MNGENNVLYCKLAALDTTDLASIFVVLVCRNPILAKQTFNEPLLYVAVLILVLSMTAGSESATEFIKKRLKELENEDSETN